MRKTKYLLLLVAACLALGSVGTVRGEFEFEILDAGEKQVDQKDALKGESSYVTKMDRGLVVPLPRTTRKGTLSYVIEHRNRLAADDEPFDNFFGFDGGGLKVGLGIQYGITDAADVSIYRLNGTTERFDTYQFTGKSRWLNEAEHGVDSVFLGGASLFTVADDSDDWGAFAGVIVGKSINPRFYMSGGLLYHADSTAEGKTRLDEKESSALMGTFLYWLSDRVSYVLDYSIPIEGYESNSSMWAMGFKFVTHGHSFSIVGSNSQYMGLDGLAAGTSRESDEMLLGFAITREIR